MTYSTIILDDVRYNLVPADSPNFRWGARSIRRMEGLHKDLVAVLDAAIGASPIDLTILEGLRTKQRQLDLVRTGASRTMNSRHLTGHAVDLAPLVDGEVSWDWPLYDRVAPVIKEVASDLDVQIEWGGDWKTFRDGPHWQLSWTAYPT